MLEQQHLQGAIFSRMMLGLIGELFSIYRREGSNPGMSFNDLLVSMTIYARADTDAPEVTVPEIVRVTALSRTSVERSLDALLEVGMIRRNDALRNTRFVSNPDFANNEALREQSIRVRALILSAADELRTVVL